MHSTLTHLDDYLMRVRVEGILNGYGWKRTRNKSDESWKIKWCELRSSINFQTFKEGWFIIPIIIIIIIIIIITIIIKLIVVLVYIK